LSSPPSPDRLWGTSVPGYLPEGKATGAWR